ncbi:MAG TPA: hypothetical protein VFS32_07225 [Candidatus Limnocylindrales bacterium]|nr:hypothetical protein [Candidatus Limnocylindrales bacterium]
MRVYLEIGSKRTFAGALDWPGWCRSGRREEAALGRLAAYADRYAAVVGPLGLGFEPPASVDDLAVVERLGGDATTDFGAPSIAPSVDAASVDAAEADRLLAILGACWEALDRAAEAARGRRLATGPRGGGRSREAIVDHVVGAERGYLARLGRRVDLDPGQPPAGLRAAVLDEVRTVIAEGVPPAGPRGGKRWSIRYYVRRAAWHVLDHAWELEDRTGR